ncbi:MAG: restriction endonuclease subunit S, partial [Bacilli bacterium]
DKKIELQLKKIEVLKLYKLYTSQKVLINTNNFDNCKLANILYPGNKISVNDTSKYEKITIKLNFKGLEKSNVKREMCDTRPFYIRDENEIIIGKQNYFNGSIAKVSKEFSGCICSNAIMSFKVIDDVNVNYVLYYLSQKKYIKQRAFLANGTGQKELSEKDFLNFEILIPNRDRQDQIANFCNLFIKKIEIEENKLCKLNELKKGFMQNMFV